MEPWSLETLEVHIWWASVSRLVRDAGGLMHVLSEDEKERAERFVVDPPRRRFAAGRAMLRRLLGRYLGTEPETLRFAAGEHGKPRLVNPATDIGFNLAHSDDRVVVAVARTAAPGVDVERLRTLASGSRLAQRYYSATECAAVHGREGVDQTRAFFHVWTCKEAYLKATGMGITVPLATIEVDPDPDRPPRLVRLAGDVAAAARWMLLDADVGTGYVCRAAMEGRDWKTVVRELRELA